MTERERIIDQLDRAYQGEAWHGPSVCEVIAGLSAAQAAARPVPEAHTIWELVLHIAAWEDAVRRRLEGDRAELSETENWPPVADGSAAAWSKARNALKQAHEGLVAAVGRLDEATLDRPILVQMPSTYATLHGVIQHSLYHTGQIAVLREGGGDCRLTQRFLQELKT